MKIGITSGAFDLFHPGHIVMLKEARSVCDYLIVYVQVDPSIDRKDKRKPIQTLLERVIQVEACRYVDQVRVYETERDFLNILSITDANIRINGSDHKDKTVPSLRDLICKHRGIEIYYTKRDHTWSTTELIERIRK
jgi:glycerol-3-phosphate cytidylyltransferase